MKKTMIALVVTAMTATSVQAAPMVDSFYTGLKTGWVSGHYDINQFNNIDRDDVTYGLFGGYQFAKNFAVELGYDYFGKIKTDKIDVRHHGASLSLKGSYPVPMMHGLDMYGKLGAAFIHSHYDVNSAILPNNVNADNKWRVSPLMGVGFEYVSPAWQNLAFNLEYQWINEVGKVNGVDFKPSLATLTAGVAYRFGAKVAEPMLVDQSFVMNSDVMFAFNSANLTSDARSQLNNIYQYLQQVKPHSITVAGYADRIGTEKENTQLSLERAENVAHYLVNKGVEKNMVSVEHYGAQNPVTGMSCDGIQNHTKLVDCLAPDRRAEIVVRGTK